MIDISVQERIDVIFNIPCLVLMLMNQLDRNEATEEIFCTKILDLYNKGTLDSAEEVRVACAKIVHYVSVKSVQLVQIIDVLGDEKA